MCSCSAKDFNFGAQRIYILSNGDTESEAAADYLYNHLNKRNVNKNTFDIRRSNDEDFATMSSTVYLEVVPDLKYDYEIVNTKDQLTIFGKDKAILRWLSYMLIDHWSEYHQLEVSDLPPNYVDFNSSQVNFAFQYRDPHLSANMDQDISGILYTHNVDSDWGLWGHNLRKVFGNAPSQNSLALVRGKRDEEQYCFSSENTFQAIKTFVIDQYGDGKKEAKWFMISPNDNDKVCTCTSCSKQGNTATNATPAVANLLNRLAKELPKHHFYTTAYRTTKNPPAIKLVGNTGVLFSTIDLSKAPKLNTKNTSVIEFSDAIRNWKLHTDKVYLWDYISNFDEYLTPFPVLLRVQEQIKFFKNQGIDGLFLNGSGYDYAPFDDVKTYVLSAIMINPNLSVSELIKKYNRRFYPVSGSVLASYLEDLENSMYSKNRDIGLYTSFREAMHTYFDVDRFQIFYQELVDIQNKTTGQERERVNRLIGALSYVQLQLDYHLGELKNGFLELENDSLKLSSKNDEYLEHLRNVVNEGVLNYKEDKGDLRTYLQEWDILKRRRAKVNKLIAAKVIGFNTGESLSYSNLLYDNLPGFASDFNQGWFLAGEDISLACELEKSSDAVSEVLATFLLNNKHRMLVPEKMEVIVEGTVIAHFSKDDFVVKGNLATLRKKVDIPNNKKIEIKIYKNKELKNSVIACDEIHLY